MKTDFAIFEEVVNDMGGKIEQFVPERNCYYINLGGKHILTHRCISIARESFISLELTRCKEMTHKLLIDRGLSSPATECFYRSTFTQKAAKEKLSKLKYPVIIKNAVGSNSLGIFPSITSATQALQVLKRELPTYPSLIAQEMVYGREYRVLVLGSKIIGALEMIHPFVVGDGKSNIRTLIHLKQNGTKRRTKFDSKFTKLLKNRNVTQETILKKGKKFYFKHNACLAEGGETKDVTNEVHPDVKKICVEASKSVGKYLVGIDVMCEDIASKPSKKTFSILEINGRPDMYIHYEPTHGKTRNVIKEVIKYLVKVSK
jgi:cyanophycin synthetase